MEEDIQQTITAISEEPNGENALKILHVSAYFGPTKGMHINMFLRVFNNIVEELDSAVLLLKKKYLIFESSKPEIIFVLQETRNYIRSFFKQNGGEKESFAEAVNLLTFHLLKAEIPLNYINHALSLVAYVIHEAVELTEISAGLPSLIVTGLKKHNRLLEAYVFGKSSMEFFAKALGKTHTEILTLRHNLATVLDAGEQHAKAVKVLQDLIEKHLKYSTVEDITKSLVQHARLLCELSRYKDALSLYEILIGDRNVLETSDREILEAWRDYAILLSHMGRHSKAIEILQDILIQRSRIMVEDNEFGLLTRQSLANVFREQGNCVRALEEITEVFSESTKFHGELHLDTLRAERDIGISLLSKGDHKEALEKLEDVEKKFDQNFAESHSDILRTRANIVSALMNINEYDKALQISEDAFEKYKNIFGEKRHEILRLKYNIGLIFLKQGKQSEALKILREVYAGFDDIFGPEHDETVTIKAELENLGYFQPALHKAAEERDLIKIVSLSGNKVNINKEDSEGRRLLHHAASNGHIRVAKYLLKMGAMYNVQDFSSATPYQLASDKQMKDLLNSISNLFKDVKRGILDNVESHKELINVKDKNGYSLLHWAVCNCHKLVVQQLLDAGADPKSISLKGNTPLHVASSKGYKEIAEILLLSVTGNDLSYLVNYKTTEGGNTALHVATKNNDLDMVKCLLMYGAAYDMENIEGLTPVLLSTDQHIFDLLTLIQDLFSSVQEENSMTIIQLKSLNYDNLLIFAKVHNSQGYTLLEVAIKNQHENFIHELLELLEDLNYSK
ncbi:unnamed protein product [Larinioides sclopetarius]|uniref:Uncharacterized protein n=1 Tax=Larinioides sclopetarius TaxID=280406 RepID=A0AAV1ZEK0_9ARAC